MRYKNPGLLIQAWLGHRAAPAVVVMLSLVLVGVSCGGGFALDDAFLRVFARGGGPLGVREAWDWFAWTDAGHSTSWLISEGLLPWWTSPEAVLRFFRPLTSLTHALDFALWPDSPSFMHLQSLAWYVALLVSLHGLFRQILGRHGAWVVCAALGLYALDDARGMSVGLLASRHALIGSLGAVWALRAHLKWREGWRPGAWLSVLALGLGLAGSEIAAQALWLRVGLGAGDGVRELARSSGLCVATDDPGCGVSWAASWCRLRLSRDGPGVEFLTEPMAWLTMAPSRMAALAFGQWGLVPSDFWILVPPGQGRWGFVALAVVFVGLISRGLIFVWRAVPEARFLSLGALGCMVVLCGQFPADRWLLLSGVGAMGTFALFLTGVVSRAPWFEAAKAGGAGFRVRLLAMSWFGIHVVIASILLPVRSWSPVWLDESFVQLARHLDDEQPRGQGPILILRAPDAWSASAAPVVKASWGRPTARRVHVLSATAKTVRITRRGAHSLEMEAEEGLLGTSVEEAFLGPGRSWMAHHKVSLHGFEVERLSPDAPRAPKVRVTWAEGFAFTPMVLDRARLQSRGFARAWVTP